MENVSCKKPRPDDREYPSHLRAVLDKTCELTVFLRVYSEVMLSSSSMVNADKSRLQP